MNTKEKLRIILAGIFLIWVSNIGCFTRIIAKECSFYEYPDLSPKSDVFLDMPEDINPKDTVIINEKGQAFYSHAPDFLFNDLKPMFRNKYNAKKNC